MLPRQAGYWRPADSACSRHLRMGLPAASRGQGLPSTSTGRSSLRSWGVDQAWSFTSAYSTGRPKFFCVVGGQAGRERWWAGEGRGGVAAVPLETTENTNPTRTDPTLLPRTHSPPPLPHLERVSELALCLLELRCGEGEARVLVLAHLLQLRGGGRQRQAGIGAGAGQGEGVSAASWRRAGVRTAPF